MRLFSLDSYAVQRLLHAERLGAAWTAVALNEAVAVAKEPEFLRLPIAAMTCHLTFLGQVLQWLCISHRIPTEGFGLWLRPVSVHALAGLCFSNHIASMDSIL